MFYKISAFWGGQAGSLLLWVLLLVIFGTIELFRIKNMNDTYQLGVMLIMAGATLFFLNQGIIEAFSTGSHAQYPPHPSST